MTRHFLFVAGTTIDAQRTDIAEQNTALDVARGDIRLGIPHHPGAWLRVKIQRDVRGRGVVVIVGVHKPSRLELLEVAEAASTTFH